MTIKDLSRETGFSVGTISRVLNHHPNVSEKTRAAVMEAIQRYGFQRNENAKNLKQKRQEGILVVVKGRENALFAEIIEKIQSYFDEEFGLMVYYFDETDNEVARAAQLCQEKKPKGVMFLGGNCENFEKLFGKITQPAVLVTNNAGELSFPNLSSVFTDDRVAADCAVTHLLDLGHTRIGIIGGLLPSSDTSRMRLDGAMKALHRQGIPGPLALEQDLFSFKGGYDAMTRMLAAGKRPTAVFAMSDVHAIGAIRALAEAGLRVPEDVSVCGFDGLTISSFINPKLTTVRQSAEELTDRACRILLAAIEKNASACHENVPFLLWDRESTARLQ